MAPALADMCGDSYDYTADSVEHRSNHPTNSDSSPGGGHFGLREQGRAVGDS